jgi:hypothetical protein
METFIQFYGKISLQINSIFAILLFLLLEPGLLATGQVIPRVPNCPENPTHPKAGKSYSYAVTIPAPYTIPQSYDWYVTDNPGFIAESLLITTNIIPNDKEYIDAGQGYHNMNTGTNSIVIKWTGKSAVNAKTKPYFLAIRYKGTNGTLCEAMNIKAYKIEPFNAFTLDLTNMNGPADLGLDGSNLPVVSRLCAKDVASVSYDGSKMVYDYGVNELIFKIVAANFTGGWTPTVKISGLAGTQTIGSVEWSGTTSFTGTNIFTKNSDSWAPTNKIPAPSDNLTDDGETIYIRVLVRNNDYEGIIDSSVTLSLNGISDDGNEDVHYTDCLADGFSNDLATQIILARPSITTNTGYPAQTFLP